MAVPWLGRAVVELGLRRTAQVEEALALQEREPGRSLIDLLELDLQERARVRASWDAEEGRIALALRAAELGDSDETPAPSQQVKLPCPACQLPIALRKELLGELRRCPACGVEHAEEADDAPTRPSKRHGPPVDGSLAGAPPSEDVAASDATSSQDASLGRGASNDSSSSEGASPRHPGGDPDTSAFPPTGSRVGEVEPPRQGGPQALLGTRGAGSAEPDVRDEALAPGGREPTGEERQRLADDAFAAWALEKQGLSPETVAEARSSDMPLFESLVIGDHLDLQVAMDALDPEVEVACAGCPAVYQVGEELQGFTVGLLPCPACGGVLEKPAGRGPAAGTAASATDDDRPRIGPYTLVRLLGRGGMGEVHLAKDAEGRRVALKVLKRSALEDPASRQRFEREGAALGRIDHRNVVRSLGRGFDEERQRAYVALEYVTGADIMHVLDRRPERRLELPEGCFVLAGCAHGLQAAHAAGVIHRDLKPSNVLLGAGGEVKLIDFGIALSTDVSQRLTAQGEVLGTPQYVPPEVLKGEQWTAASDVYSLGATAFRVLSGQALFPGGNVVEVLTAQLETTPRRLIDVQPDVPEAVSALVAGMLAKDPAARPSLETVIEELERHDLTPPETDVGSGWRREVTDATLAPGAVQIEHTLQRGQVFQSYRLDGELGRGGMGVVYKAFHLRLKKTVALKVLLSGAFAGEDERRRFLREAESAAALRHPFIVPVLDAGEHDGTCYLTMEFVEGLPLSQRHKEIVGLEPLLQLFAKICDAVHHAHTRGVIHRDLKPDNVIVDPDGDPHVLDFGIAKKIDADDEQAGALTTEGDIVGTLRYMPPEQASGQSASVDVRSDVYALGSILYQLVSGGATPFQGSVHELLTQILFEQPRPPSVTRPDLPWELDAICLKALEKQRDDRYQSALELKRDVERYLQGLPIAAKRATPWYRLRKWAARNKRKAALVGAGATVLLSLSGGWTYSLVAAERARRQTIVEQAAQGWRHFGLREYQQASLAFGLAQEKARGDDSFWLPSDVATLIPERIRADLPPAERERPRVTWDRLRAWAAESQQRTRLEQADQFLEEARRGVQEGDLPRAFRAIQLAAAISMEDAVLAVSHEIAAALVGEGEAALAEYAACDRADPGAFDARAAALGRASEAFNDGLTLDQQNERARAGLVQVNVLSGELALDRKDVEAHQQAVARLTEAAGEDGRGGLLGVARAEAEAGEREQAWRTLQRARQGLTVALDLWSDLRASKEGLTRVALALAELALAQDQPGVAEVELMSAKIYGLLPEQVTALEARLREHDRAARAQRAHRERAEAFYAAGQFAQALAEYDLALERRDDPRLRPRRMLCQHLVEVEAARAAGDLLALRAALLAAIRLGGAGLGLEAELARVTDALYRRALEQADAAFRPAAERGVGWQQVVAAYERALRLRPDGAEAQRGRADGYAERDRPADMVLVSAPLRLLVQGTAAARVEAAASLRFYVDRDEVTQRAYAEFVAAGGYERRELWSDEGWALRARFVDATGAVGPASWANGAPRAGRDEQPVTGISAYEAEAYARFRERRLLTEDEWAIAACFDPVSGKRQRFPWGDATTPDQLDALRRLAAVGGRRLDSSPWGARDMGFNASEWVTSASAASGWAVRGLSADFFASDVVAGVLDWRKEPDPAFRGGRLGLRCARAVPAPPALPPADEDEQ